MSSSPNPLKWIRKIFKGFVEHMNYYAKLENERYMYTDAYKIKDLERRVKLLEGGKMSSSPKLEVIKETILIIMLFGFLFVPGIIVSFLYGENMGMLIHAAVCVFIFSRTINNYMKKGK